MDIKKKIMYQQRYFIENIIYSLEVKRFSAIVNKTVHD